MVYIILSSVTTTIFYQEHVEQISFDLKTSRVEEKY